MVWDREGSPDPEDFLGQHWGVWTRTGSRRRSPGPTPFPPAGFLRARSPHPSASQNLRPIAHPNPSSSVPPLRFRPGRPVAPGQGQNGSGRPFPGTRGQGRSRCQGSCHGAVSFESSLFPFLSFPLLCSLLLLLRFLVSLFALPLSWVCICGAAAAPLGCPGRSPSPCGCVSKSGSRPLSRRPGRARRRSRA